MFYIMVYVIYVLYIMVNRKAESEEGGKNVQFKFASIHLHFSVL